MKKITYLSLVALMGATSLVSCSDFLDTNNKSAGTDADAYFSTEEGKAAAKAQAYYSLKALGANYDMNCAGTDLYVPVRGKDPGNFQRYSLTPEEKGVADYYSNCFNLIKYGMFYAEKSGEGTTGAAEGKFLRDYAYYLLTQQYGGVPYVDHYISDANRNYPKASVDSIYTVMEADLEDIYNNGGLPETSKDGTVNKQAVASLLAKYYLAHGWDVDTKLDNAVNGTYTVNSKANFSKAAEWAVKAINGQQLTQTFEAKWSPSNEGNNEQIWTIQYERKGYPGDIDKGGNSLQNMFGNYYGDPTKTGLKKVGSMGDQSEKSLYLFSKGDERYKGTFMTSFYNWDGTTGDGWSNTGYYAYYNNPKHEDLPVVYMYFPAYTTTAEAEAYFKDNKEKFVTGDYTNKSVVAYILSIPAVQYTFNATGGFTKKNLTYSQLKEAVGGGTSVKKFDDPNTQCLNNDNIGYRNIVVFDLSDLYLTAAEAYLMAGDESKALSYVNDVRNRAKAGALSSFGSYKEDYSTTSTFGNITPLDVVLDERARELYGQQVRWVDLRRTKQLVRYNLAFNNYITSVEDMKGVDGNIKWLKPIPQAAINGNLSMSTSEQNLGY